MAAKFKKRLIVNENKLLKLEKLQFKDVICSICQSILIEPVTLPCYHDFCLGCFHGSVENNALCCPLCRLRIGSWLRTATKQRNLVNTQLWDYIQSKFHTEVNIRLRGGDIYLPEELPQLRLSAPGEIRSEYEAELRRLKSEREKIEQKQLKETEELIWKIRKEEEEAHAKYIEKLKHDEELAQQIHKCVQSSKSPETKANLLQKNKSKLRCNTIDKFLLKTNTLKQVVDDSIMTDDNSSNHSSTPNAVSEKNSRTSPEIVPSYRNYLKNYIDKKLKIANGLWNKENGAKDKKMISNNNEEKLSKNDSNGKLVQSLPVSLPFTGILKLKKLELRENPPLETGSVDSMQQELCYFKPIEVIAPTKPKADKVFPIRVPCLRAEKPTDILSESPPVPSPTQHLEGLCQLRHGSLAQNLPSAFILALNIMGLSKCNVSGTEDASKESNKEVFDSLNKIDVNNLNRKRPLRRTRSVGYYKADNERTPKKTRTRGNKPCSEEKRCLRSDTKRNCSESNRSPVIFDKTINNKINLVKKQIISPVKSCDVKQLLEEQLRIEKIIEQEKKDLEMARKIDAQINGGRQLRRQPVKRQLTINYALRPGKKFKV